MANPIVAAMLIPTTAIWASTVSATRDQSAAARRTPGTRMPRISSTARRPPSSPKPRTWGWSTSAATPLTSGTAQAPAMLRAASRMPGGIRRGSWQIVS
jgi:hypothetical protein